MSSQLDINPLPIQRARDLLALPSSPFFISAFLLGTAYHLLRPAFSTPKQASWILSTISAGVMSLSSLPFLYDYIAAGGMVQGVRTMPWLDVTVGRFFQAYLATDLAFGMVYYRAQVGLLTGWIHHSLYIFIVEFTIRRSWMHIFCLASVMEIPTFILGLTTLHPPLRSNLTFALSFFLTRIIFHLVLLFSYLPLEARLKATGGSLVPSLILALVFPLHAMWFYGCVKGFLRRAREKKERISGGGGGGVVMPAPLVTSLEIFRSTDSPPTTPSLEDVPVPASMSMFLAPSPSPPSPSPSSPSSSKHQGRFATLPFYRRRISYERERSAGGEKSGTKREVRGLGGRVSVLKVFPKEKVFDFVGLGRAGPGGGAKQAI